MFVSFFNILCISFKHSFFIVSFNQALLFSLRKINRSLGGSIVAAPNKKIVICFDPQRTFPYNLTVDMDSKCVLRYNRMIGFVSSFYHILDLFHFYFFFFLLTEILFELIQTLMCILQQLELFVFLLFFIIIYSYLCFFSCFA